MPFGFRFSDHLDLLLTIVIHLFGVTVVFTGRVFVDKLLVELDNILKSFFLLIAETVAGQVELGFYFQECELFVVLRIGEIFPEVLNRNYRRFKRHRVKVTDLVVKPCAFVSFLFQFRP
ncbi:hypothetical protein D3C87_1504810 [compost metagenome]